MRRGSQGMRMVVSILVSMSLMLVANPTVAHIFVV
jgi:hypothetical protein